MQHIGDVVDGLTLARELLLYRNSDSFEEILIMVLLLQLFLKLRRKHFQEFGIAGDERNSTRRQRRERRSRCEMLHTQPGSQSDARSMAFTCSRGCTNSTRNGDRRVPVPCRAMESTHAKTHSISTGGSTSSARSQRNWMQLLLRGLFFADLPGR